MNFILVVVVFLATLFSASCRFHCHNNCGGKTRGYCNYDQTCVCNEGYTGIDCSRRHCPYDIAWADKAYAVDTAHSLSECSNQGICDTTTGTCKCFPGYTGIACQQTTCGGCNGRGECKTLQEIYEYRQTQSGVLPLATYTSWEFNHTTACVCDFGYSGANCEYQLCPKGDDPVTPHNGYPEVLLALNYPEGTSDLGGYFLINYLGASLRITPEAEVWNASHCKAAFEALPNIDRVNCTIIQIDAIHRLYSIQLQQLARLPYENNIYFTDGQFADFNADQPLNPMNCDASFITGTYADLVTCSVTMAHNNLTYPEYVFCSNRGMCDFKYGVCSCFEDFTNSDCSDYSVGYSNYSRLIATDVLALETTNTHFVDSLVTLDTVGEGVSTFDALTVADSDSTIFHLDGYGNAFLNYGGLTVLGTLDTGGASVANAGLVVTGGMTIRDSGMKVSSTSRSSIENGLVVKQSGLQITGGATVLAGGLFAVDGATIYDKGMRVDNGVMMFAGGATVTLGGLAVTTGMTVGGGGLLINKHGATVKSGGLYILDGGLALNGLGSGLEMPNGLTISAGGLAVTQGVTIQTYGLYAGPNIVGMTVRSAGFVATGGLTVNNLGITVSNGLTVQDSGLQITGGLTVIAGNVFAGISGMSVSAGITVSASGLVVTNGLTLTTGNLLVTGDSTISSGDMVLTAPGTATTYITDKGASAGYLAVTGGMVVTGQVKLRDFGLTASEGMTVSNGGLVVSGQVNIDSATSLAVTGGLTVTTDGVLVAAHGFTVLGGGLLVSGGASIDGRQIVVTGGFTVASGGASIHSMTIQTVGLKVTNGLTIVNGAVVTTGGMTVQSGGMVVSSGLSYQNVKVTGGVSVWGSGLVVTQGITMNTGGFLSSNGLVSFNSAGVVVTGGATVADYGLTVTSGGLTVKSGGLVATDLVAWDQAKVTLGGISVFSDGLTSNAMMTIANGMLVSSGTASTIQSNGLTVVTSGLTVTSGGLYVTTGGLSVVLGGLSVVGGMSVSADASSVSGVVFVTPRGAKADSVIVKDLGVIVTGGLSVAVGPFNSVSGGLSITSQGMTVTDGMSVADYGLQISNGGVTISNGGLSVVAGGMSMVSGGWTTYGGISVGQHGVSVNQAGAKIISGGVTAGGLSGEYLNGLSVTDGLSVAHDGMTVVKGMTVGIGGVTVDGGVSVEGGGLYLANLLPLVINDGLNATHNYTGYDPVYWEYSATVYSDQRLKTNVSNIEDALFKVSQMRGVYYRWKDDASAHSESGDMNEDAGVVTAKSAKNQRHVGFVAQEIQAIIPELTEVFDSEGHIGVKYDDMSAVVLEAVRLLDRRTKEQQQELEAQLLQQPEEVCPCREELERQLSALLHSIDRLKEKEAMLKELLDEAEKSVGDVAAIFEG